MLTDKSLRDLLAAFGSPAPTPGGGSAAALASAVGASLLLMVAGLPKTRSGSDEDRAALAAILPELHDVQRRLTDAVDGDAAAYDRVIEASRRPKGSDRERQVRRAAIEAATAGATEVPLSVMRYSVAALTAAKTIAAHGNRSAASDVGVAIALVRAGLHAARLNVEINLDAVNEPAFVAAVDAESTRLVAEGDRAAREAEASLRP